MKKALLFTLICIGFVTFGNSQTEIEAKRLQKSRHPASLQLGIGSLGVSGDFKVKIRKKLSLRVGGAYATIDNLNNLSSLPNFVSNNVTSATFTNTHLMIEYSPFKGDGFRLVGGAGYYFNSSVTVNILSKGTYYFGNIPLNTNVVGTTALIGSLNGLAPYLGTSFFKGFPKHRLNLTLDVGTYYLSQPVASVSEGTGLLKGNVTCVSTLQQNINGYRWYPVIQLNFNVKL
jgi:hypothetical protein